MDQFKLTSGDLAALVIFVVSVLARSLLQAFGGPTMDYAWVTTFAVIAAAWLSLGSRSRDIHTAAMEAKETAKEVAVTAAEVAENTNGRLDAKLSEQTKQIVAELKPEE
jgi:hypothetical protein